jgi:hypothetical protein
MEKLMEEGALDPGGENVRVAKGEGGGADFGGGDGWAFEEPVCVWKRKRRRWVICWLS